MNWKLRPSDFMVRRSSLVIEIAGDSLGYESEGYGPRFLTELQMGPAINRHMKTYTISHDMSKDERALMRRKMRRALLRALAKLERGKT